MPDSTNSARMLACACLLLCTTLSRAQFNSEPQLPTVNDSLNSEALQDSTLIQTLLRAIAALPKTTYRDAEWPSEAFTYGIRATPMDPPYWPRASAQDLVAALEEALRIAKALAEQEPSVWPMPPALSNPTPQQP